MFHLSKLLWMSVGRASLELSDILTKFCAAMHEYATLSNYKNWWRQLQHIDTCISLETLYCTGKCSRYYSVLMQRGATTTKHI